MNKTLNCIIKILLCSTTGFGMFWLYQLLPFKFNIFFNMFIGMITVSTTTLMIFDIKEE